MTYRKTPPAFTITIVTKTVKDLDRVAQELMNNVDHPKLRGRSYKNVFVEIKRVKLEKPERAVVHELTVYFFMVNLTEALRSAARKTSVPNAVIFSGYHQVDLEKVLHPFP